MPLLPSASRIRGAGDSVLFFGFTLLGAAVIATLKFLGVNGLIVACLAVSAMLAYGLLALFRADVRMRPDKLGDNVYYMGFIFTLTSMSVALVALQLGADVSSLIGSFGISLFTTIAGIVGRVLLLQMRTEVEDVEEIVRRDLLEHTERLRGQLTAAVSDLEVFRLGVGQAVERRLHDSLQAHDEAIRAQLGLMERVTEESCERLRAAYDANAATLAEMRDGMRGMMKSLKAAWDRLEKIEPPSDVLDRKLEGTMGRISKAIGAFEDSARAEADRHQAMASAAEDFGATVQTLRDELSRLGALAETVAQAGLPSDQLRQGLNALRMSVEEVAEAIASQGELVKASVEVAERHQNALGRTLQGSQEKLHALQAAVTVASSAVTTGAKAMGDQMRGAAEALAGQQNELSSATGMAANTLLRGAREMEEQLAVSSDVIKTHREEVAVAAAEAGNAILRSARDLEDQLRGASDAVKAQRAVLAASMRDATEARQQIASDLDASRVAMMEIQHIVLEAARAHNKAAAEEAVAR
ncbi:hypothetical protein QMO56_18410 [Roseomonas sp. E05]|uniref:hypothetical protein n=1 Tax=Roseomonas sp. E05 TaxID=3046310 RepID=UPI0024BBA9B1|nr:hypothetical protein [Roseomonas sp. E05]MDJ0390086.1 hypothetical protein [Roseomonas sp. E05]